MKTNIITREYENTVFTLEIDALGRDISCKAAGGINYVMKITNNKEYVLKINKTSISTCNIEMLAELLKNDDTAFIAVHSYLYRNNAFLGYKVSKSQFYNSYNDKLGDFAVFFAGADSTTRRLIIYDHCCDDHTAKMSGMISYSTSVELNHFCNCRMKKECAVCKHCFAFRQLAIYNDQRNKLKRAHVIATRCKWAVSDIPVIDYKKYPYFRLESFGDINNTLQVENYNTLAIVNAHNGVMTTLWTKNPGIIQQAVNNGLQLSKHLVIGLSSLELNKPEISKAKKYKFVRFVFTVFTPEYAIEHNITINCGGRHCLSCLRCYETAASSNDLIIVNELLK